MADEVYNPFSPRGRSFDPTHLRLSRPMEAHVRGISLDGYVLYDVRYFIGNDRAVIKHNMCCSLVRFAREFAELL